MKKLSLLNALTAMFILNILPAMASHPFSAEDASTPTKEEIITIFIPFDGPNDPALPYESEWLKQLIQRDTPALYYRPLDRHYPRHWSEAFHCISERDGRNHCREFLRIYPKYHGGLDMLTSLSLAGKRSEDPGPQVFLDPALAQLSNLRKFMFECQVLHKDDRTIISTLTGLTSLTIRFDSFGSQYVRDLGFDRLANLTELNLFCYTKRVFDADLLKGLSRLPHLGHLGLGEVKFWSHNDMWELRGFTGLKSLAIHQPERLVFEGEPKFPKNLTSLECLDVHAGKAIGEYTLGLFSHISDLKKLRIRNYGECYFNKRNIAFLRKSHPNLEELILPGARVTYSIDALTSLPKLNFLLVKWASTGSEEIKAAFNHKLPECKLRFLNEEADERRI